MRFLGQLICGLIYILANPAEAHEAIQVGFGQAEIALPKMEPWVDVDRNARYDAKIDSYTDVNRNGTFDTLWLAGYHEARAAQSIHDAPSAQAVLFRTKDARILMMAIDAIGLFYDDIETMRQAIHVAVPQLDFILIASTHSHEVPDTMGLWGPRADVHGVHPAMLDAVKVAAVQAARAAAQVEPAKLVYGLVEPKDESTLQNDSRMPFVFDRGIRYIQVSNNSKILGTLVFWSNHPEVAGDKNLAITADFPYFLRRRLQEKWGGTAVFFNGAIGGLMSTNDYTVIEDKANHRKLQEPSLAKAQAVGEQVADAVTQSLNARQGTELSALAKLSFDVRPFTVNLTNPAFVAAINAGVIRRRLGPNNAMPTEVSLIRWGPLRFLGIPGEIYPEIVNGGIESPAGADFAGLKPQEVPPLRDAMTAKKAEWSVIIGLAGDEIGYLVPKSQWDQLPPFTYGRPEAPYGERNSVGPEAAATVHREAMILIEIER